MPWTDPYEDDDYDDFGEWRPYERAYYDLEARRWVCRCDVFKAKGSCHHMSFWRPTRELKVKEEYL
jgi:hypothetical protein